MKRLLLVILLVSSYAAAQTTAIGGATGYQNVANDATTGTLLNGAVCFTSANPSAAISCPTTTTAGVAGICTANCGTGTVKPLLAGTTGQIVTAVFDGATTAGDYVTVSTTTAGNLHDAGTTAPTLNLGKVLSSCAVGTCQMVWRGTVDPGGGGAIFTANAIQYATSTTASRAATATDVGTLGTLSNATSGNAATATNISTNGTANQLWGMNAGATAQGWQNPPAGGTPDFTAGWTVANATAGGIPYFSSTTQGKSTGAFTSTQMIIGGGVTGPTGLTITASGVPCNNAGTLTSSGGLTNQAIVTGGAAGCPIVPGPTMTSTQMNWAATSIFQIIGSGTSANTAYGGLIVGAGEETGAGGPASLGKPVVFGRGNNSSTNTAATASSVAMFGGAALGATSTGHQGFIQFGAYFLKGATVTPWNLQCSSGTAETVVDCGATPAYIIGVAQNNTAPSVLVIESGEVPINCSNCTSGSIGHTVCAGATAGQVTDSGGSAACSTGFTLGIVNRVTGAYTLPNGTAAAGSGDAVTLSSTAPGPVAVIILSRK